MATQNNKLPNLEIINAKIKFKNFTGVERRNPNTNKIVNREGDRNFSVQIDDYDLAQELKRTGHNVTIMEPDGETYTEPLCTLKVHVDYEKAHWWPVSIWLITKKEKKLLTEETIDTLDRLNIDHVNLLARQHEWEVNGSTGIKCHVSQMAVYAEEDDFEERFAQWESPEE